MKSVNKLMMIAVNVRDMPKAKAFYEDMLGLKVATDYRMDDDNWWVTLNTDGDGVSITLSRATGFENMKPGTMALYFETSDVTAAREELNSRGLKVSVVQDDLFGPGSGVKFFNLEDPDGNLVHLVAAHKSRAPF